ncbi:MAG: DUF2332 domain-containing protein [Ilumatobacter sp.]|nr:DUF2332 domain-containing protein [Ilumatobacter sp.]
MATVDELQRRFRDFGHDQESRSPFTAGLSRRLADEPTIAALLQAAPEPQQLPVLLFAAVHSIVLAEPDLELAAWYPTTSSDLRGGDPFPAFARLCRAREDQLQGIISTRSTQTNEVGRSALFLPVLGRLHDEVGPVSIVDVGASAGLNLHLDAFGYRYEPGGTVNLPSTVVIETGTRGAVPVPPHVPEITHRCGLDRSPIDIDDEQARRWLLACIWPDQRDRFDRIRAAIEIARANPAPVVAGDAVDDLRPLLDRAVGAGHAVVLNSWVLNYLADDRRRAYVRVLDDFGADHDFSWVFAESPAMCPGLPFGVVPSPREPLTALTIARWRDGRRTVTHLGEAHPHGYWLHWVA